VHSGKDMRDTHTLIGTGGIFVHNPHAGYILAQRPATDAHGVQALRPRDPQIYLDSSYILYAVGLLSETMPQVALKLFKRYIAPVAKRR
ncbi:MAG: glutamate mutase L, partial [Candidatus Binatia bacterium]